MTRFLKMMVPIFLILTVWGGGPLWGEENDPIPIGSERQLFLDDQFLIDSMDSVEVLVHHPVRREICDYRNRPWEGNGSRFMTVLYDPQEKIYRLYSTVTQAEHIHPWNTEQIHVSYLESLDGIHWNYRPLNLLEYEGSTENNLVIKGIMTFTPFIDSNPNALPEERYKGIGAKGNGGMTVWTSPDGIHWNVKNHGENVYVPDTPNAFDSQNIGFWSEREGRYVVYYRCHDKNHCRSVERAVSDDFIHWTKQDQIQVPPERAPQKDLGEFYTNNIQPYYRAPQIFLGFPARYNNRGFTESFKLLPEQEERAFRIEGSGNPRFGTVTSDSVFFSSRDGFHFNVSNDVFLAPGLRTKNNWSYGDNYFACGMVETQSPEEDEGIELSMYAAESSFTGDDEICRRYSLRIDGFSSLHAKSHPGSVTLKPVTWSGKSLSLNIATSGFGCAYVEICDLNGNPIEGFTKDDCDIIYGDSLDRRVTWKGSSDLTPLAGKPIVLKFYLCESDLYSLKFEE